MNCAIQKAVFQLKRKFGFPHEVQITFPPSGSLQIFVSDHEKECLAFVPFSSRKLGCTGCTPHSTNYNGRSDILDLCIKNIFAIDQ